jgi:hypothetical protein
MPDGLQLLSSMPALALAAGATTTLHVGNFVIASSMADELLRRRDDLGISYSSVNAAFLQDFAPVIELLDGR